MLQTRDGPVEMPDCWIRRLRNITWRMIFDCGSRQLAGIISGRQRRYAARRLGLRLGVTDAGKGACLCRLVQREGANTDRVSDEERLHLLRNAATDVVDDRVREGPRATRLAPIDTRPGRMKLERRL